MIWHLLGWATLASQLFLGAGVTGYLVKVGNRPWTWQRPPAIPSLASHDHWKGPASDVGYV